jgi:hypothetical protein
VPGTRTRPWRTGRAGVLKGVVTRVTPVPNVLGITVGGREITFIEDGGEPSATTPVDSFMDLPDLSPQVSCKSAFGDHPENVEEGNVNIKLLG